MTFSELYETADADARQWLDERAAIREYDGGATRREAESATAREWLSMATAPPEPARDAARMRQCGRITSPAAGATPPTDQPVSLVR